MRILSMTATFGKLENQTLTLQPGLNVIEAPNEWGKSTWCAFITAMLYGIETRAHTTKTALADKERYAPWSGSPMSGRIDLRWEGRNITIERSSKGRNVFGSFRAYETETGIVLPELTAANCGQVLLGVEKSVFLRAGFLKLNDLPVTQDEALRRRLNDIVTTGDESGTADVLAQRLKDLKNRCRANRSTGLLPQAEVQRSGILQKLNELEALNSQLEWINQRLGQLEQWKRKLENHQIALHYADSESHGEKLSAAQAALDAASLRKDAAALACRDLPTIQESDGRLLQLRQLRDLQDSLHMELRMLPQEPEKPDILPLFRDQDPQAVIAEAEKDAALYMQNGKPLPFPWYWILGLLLAVAAVILIPHWTKWLVGGTVTALCAALAYVGLSKRNRRRKICDSLTAQYHPVPPEQWIAAAQHYEKSHSAYTAALDKYKQEREQLDARAEELQSKITEITGGRSLAECEDFYIQAQRQFQDYATAIREHSRAAELVQALRASHRDVPAPAFPDTLTYSEQDTARLLSDCDYEYRQLQLKLGNTQGRIEALGKEAILRSQLESVTRRIADLENTHAALELAQKTLSDARIQLQRRFAPRITKRAQEIFTRLTGGRYTRLTLADDLAAHVQTTDEATLRSVLWRSEGTVDQLYLSLRLAVAEALTPNAPLVLDDALVRFDGKRLAQALTVLQEESQSKQIILFTCQSREAEVLKGLR